MEGADPHIPCTVAHQFFHTFLHFPCRLIGKGDGKDIPGFYACFQQVGNTYRQGTCLAAARPRQNQHRAFCLQNCFFLHIVQLFKSNHDPYSYPL